MAATHVLQRANTRLFVRLDRRAWAVAVALVTLLVANVFWLSHLPPHDDRRVLQMPVGLRVGDALPDARRGRAHRPRTVGQALQQLAAGAFKSDPVWRSWLAEPPPLSSPELGEYGLFYASGHAGRLPCPDAFSEAGGSDVLRFPPHQPLTNDTVGYLARLLDATLPGSSASLRAAQTVLTTLRASRRAWDDFLKSDEPAAYAREGTLYRRAANAVAAHYAQQLMVRPPTVPGTGPNGPPVNPCKRLVVAFSTLPSRIPRLGAVLRALKSQRLQPDAILIGVPPFATRLRQTYELPPEIADDPAITIVPLPADFGPSSKLMAALLAEPDPDTCIITCVGGGRGRKGCSA